MTSLVRDVRRTFAALAAASAWFLAGAAHAPAADLDRAASAPIAAAIGALNRADRAAFVAAFKDDAIVVDEISPFVFAGDGAPGKWFDRLAEVNKGNAISAERTELGTGRFAQKEGDRAYVVVPARIAYIQKSTPVKLTGTWTFALERSAGTWKIVTATWSSADSR